MPDQLNNPTPSQLQPSPQHKQGHSHPTTNTRSEIPQNFNMPFLKDQLSYKAQKDIT